MDLLLETGTTVVKIVISDVNDSPPKLIETEGFINENRPRNSFVMQLAAYDEDLAPNTGPFLYTLINDHEMLSLDSKTGIITTKRVIDREDTPFIIASVQIKDSGVPPLVGTYDIKIVVGDENDNPSYPKNIDVIIKNYDGTFPGGVIAPIRPNDVDISGNYKCELLKGPENIFNVSSGCNVTAGRIHNGREYELQVLVNDGRHSNVQVNAKLNFVGFSKFAVEESVALRIRNATSENILKFFEGLTVPFNKKLLELLSLTKWDETSVICYLVLKDNELYLPKTDTLNFLQEKSENLQREFNVELDFNPCVNENPCFNNGKCSSMKQVKPETEIIGSENIIFNSPKIVQATQCKCLDEFVGDKCEIQRNPCNPNPCGNEGGKCIRDSKEGFKCLCPPLRGGSKCQEKIEDTCKPDYCLYGGTCKRSTFKEKTSFFCLCRPGYQGDRCELTVNSCRTNPCQNGGICVPQKPNYRCQCPDNFLRNTL